MRNIVTLAIAGIILAGCESTHVTQLSWNQVLVDVEAAPACGSNGAAKVAQR